MGAITLTSTRHKHRSTKDHQHSPIMDEIEGLIRVHMDGHVDRSPIVKDVPCTWSVDPGVSSADVIIHNPTRLWARLYVPPRRHHDDKLPVILYFHGGGFCLGSASWLCYHEFLSRLSSTANCVIVSVNYRLAPEHRLPAAYEDGLRAAKWLVARHHHSDWWTPRCDFVRIFVSGDSAGGAIAYQVATQLGNSVGCILIQPFFGGEVRTVSERTVVQPVGSVLTLAVSDAYWRMALPVGVGRDHPWCNPMVAGARRATEEARMGRVLVCVAEMDILRDREMEVCRAMRRAGKEVEVVVHGGVGHAFHVLGMTRLAQGRTQEMMAQIKSFIRKMD